MENFDAYVFEITHSLEKSAPADDATDELDKAFADLQLNSMMGGRRMQNALAANDAHFGKLHTFPTTNPLAKTASEVVPIDAGGSLRERMRSLVETLREHFSPLQLSLLEKAIKALDIGAFCQVYQQVLAELR